MRVTLMLPQGCGPCPSQVTVSRTPGVLGLVRLFGYSRYRDGHTNGDRT